jgi:hypothetical protein
VRRHAKASTAGSTQQLERTALSAGVLVAILAVLALLAGTASALKTHLPKETFGSVAQPSFGDPRGIAVDQSSGDLLVMDSGGTPSIKRFNPDGTPADFSALGTNVIDGQGAVDGTPQNGLTFFSPGESQIAVDNSGTATDGDIYVTQGSPNLINIFSEDGEYLGQLTAAGTTDFTEACGVAVDPSGAVYVGDYGSGIYKFAPSANPPVNADEVGHFTSVSSPCTLAAGAGPTAGSIFPASYNGPIYKLDSSTGDLEYTVFPASTTTLSVDPATGHIYAASGSSVKELDASGPSSASSVSSFTTSSQVRGVAAHGSSGDVYVSRAGATNVEVFGPLVDIASAATTAATDITSSAAILNGIVSPQNTAITECKFEYGTTSSYGSTAPCEGAIPTDSSDHAVTAAIAGLAQGTIYHFRIVAASASGSVTGDDESFETLSSPQIPEQWAEGVGFTEATLKAKINPKGFATTFHLEYGTDSSYGQSTPEAGIGSDKADHIVTRTLESLAPGTTYHYRFVATNTIGTSVGSDHTFTTYEPFASDTNCANQEFRGGSAANLADCRGYEMVSPVDKDGGDIFTWCNVGCYRTGYNRSSADGDKFTYSSYKSFGDEPSAQYVNQYIASRGADGWSSHGINAPQGPTIFDPSLETFHELFEPRIFAFSEDLSVAWMRNFNRTPLTPDGLEGYANLYRRDNLNDSYEALTVNYPIGPAEKTLGVGATNQMFVEGVSADGSHVVFGAYAALTPDAVGGAQKQLYEFSEGEIHLVSVMPGGEPSPKNASAGTGPAGGFSGDHRGGIWRNAVSEDGSRIYWSTRSRLFLRIDGEATVPVSIGEAGFRTASRDGSKALFLENFTASLPDLYEYDAETETRSLIAHESYGLLGASDDLSRIYFVSRDVLDTGATVGKPNLYLDQEGAVSFIATVTPQDVRVESPGLATETGITVEEPTAHSSRVTPDGRHIAFTSHASLTGYDNTAANSGKPAMEVFTYDADTDELTCASCNPTGERPVAQKLLRPFTVVHSEVGDFGPDRQWAASWLTTEEASLYSSNPLSDDGSHLFFNSFEALVPQDSNGVQDVYEWRSPGTSGCEEPDGCISLISTGQSPEVSEFVDASPDGRNVFFETSSSIDPEDPGLIDIYDARIDGGYPYTSPTEPCVGDACQNVPAPPNDQTPASSSFRGAGDPKPQKPRPRCRARKRKAARGSSRRAKRKAAKHCSRANGRAGR